MADELVRLGSQQCIDLQFYSPFSQQAEKANKAYIGGKPDDITALLSVVTQTSQGYA